MVPAKEQVILLHKCPQSSSSLLTPRSSLLTLDSDSHFDTPNRSSRNKRLFLMRSVSEVGSMTAQKSWEEWRKSLHWGSGVFPRSPQQTRDLWKWGLCRKWGLWRYKNHGKNGKIVCTRDQVVPHVHLNSTVQYSVGQCSALHYTT